MLNVVKHRVSMKEVVENYWISNGDLILDSISDKCKEQKEMSKIKPAIGDYNLNVDINDYVNKSILGDEAVIEVTKKIIRGVSKRGLHVIRVDYHDRTYLRVYDSMIWYLFDLYDKYSLVLKVTILAITACLVYIKEIGGV